MSIESDSVGDISDSSLRKDESGLKFLFFWAASGVILILFCFGIISHIVGNVSQQSFGLSNSPKSSFRALIIKAGSDEESIEGWKNLLQRWAFYIPCGLHTTPVNFEQTDVDLYLHLPRNNTALAQLYREIWMLGSESMRLCFRELIITEMPVPEDGFYMYSNLSVIPVKANWLNKLIQITQSRSKADFIGSRMNSGEGHYNSVGIYNIRKHRPFAISETTPGYDLGDVADYQLINKEKTALFSLSI